MKTKKKTKKKPKPIMFVQDFGTYTNEILVLCGVTDKKELLKYLKKVKAKFEFSKWVLEDFDGWKKDIEKKHLAQFCFNNEIQGGVLMLRPMEDCWNYWEVLMHEVHHIVQNLAKQKGMFEELEAQAYLFEYLFKSIRRILMGVDKPNI